MSSFQSCQFLFIQRCGGHLKFSLKVTNNSSFSFKSFVFSLQLLIQLFNFSTFCSTISSFIAAIFFWESLLLYRLRNRQILQAFLELQLSWRHNFSWRAWWWDTIFKIGVERDEEQGSCEAIEDPDFEVGGGASIWLSQVLAVGLAWATASTGVSTWRWNLPEHNKENISNSFESPKFWNFPKVWFTRVLILELRGEELLNLYPSTSGRLCFKNLSVSIRLLLADVMYT